jgi:hypothetical protein
LQLPPQDGGEPAGSDESEEATCKPKVKRGRALTRQATDEQMVPFISHVVSGEVVKEFMYELKSNWSIFGTSEVGVGARGSLALKKPVVLFAHNEIHEKILREGLEAGIVATALRGGDFSSKTLVASWQALQAASTDSTSSSDGKTSDHNSGSDNDAEAVTKDKKDKKEKKEKNTKKNKKEKKSKKDKKKEKNSKKVKKEEKKDPKESDTSKPAPATKSSDVLQALIASETGTQKASSSAGA